MPRGIVCKFVIGSELHRFRFQSNATGVRRRAEFVVWWGGVLAQVERMRSGKPA